MREALLILLSMSSCLLLHIFMHKAMMKKECHGNSHQKNEEHHELPEHKTSWLAQHEHSPKPANMNEPDSKKSR